VCVCVCVCVFVCVFLGNAQKDPVERKKADDADEEVCMYMFVHTDFYIYVCIHAYVHTYMHT